MVKAAQLCTLHIAGAAQLCAPQMVETAQLCTLHIGIAAPLCAPHMVGVHNSVLHTWLELYTWYSTNS
jgi:hypothetical protein